MANDTVWIIVPVYNAQKTLKKCVRSIQKQTYKNWRLVLVDDGSKDKSGKMCDKFAKRDNRIVVLHTKNGGSAAARKRGISQVPDDSFCAFCDSDDWMPKNALEILYSEFLKANADLVCARCVSKYKFVTIGHPAREFFSNTGVFNKEEIRSRILLGLFDGSFPTGQWAKLYKSSQLKRIMLDECVNPNFYAEDWDINLRLMPLLGSVSIVNEVVYYYQAGGGTSKFMPTYLDDSLLLYQRKKQYLHYYTGEEDAIGKIATNIVICAITYLIMCKRFERYKTDDLTKEVEYICSLPEIKEALTEKIAENLNWAYPGAWECMINNDISGLEKIVIDYVEMLKQRTLFRKIIGVLKK